MNFGKAFKVIRDENDLTRSELALLLDCTPSSLSKIEREKVVPKYSTIEFFCEKTGTPLARFFTLAFEDRDFR